jgi:protein-tyrosine phosphatase
MEKPIKNSYWVVEGKFLAGEYPKGHLKELIEAGVKCFIDLTDNNRYSPYEDEAKELSNNNAEVHIFPVTDRSIPKSPEYTKKILDVIDKNIDKGGIVYIHCLAGIGRTGTLVGCWLGRHGYSGKDTLKRLNELWQDNPVSKYTEIPQTALQCDYVKNWKE